MDQDNTGTPNPIAPEGASIANENKSEAPNQTTVEPVSPAPVTPAPSTDPKKPKGLITTTIILAILAIAGVAFGIYGMFFKTQPNSQPEPNQTSNNTEEPTEEPTTTKNEETEITDTYILRDLDEKIALLHFTNQTGTTLYFPHGIHLEFPLYQNGTLDDVFKLMGVINFLGNDFRQIYPAERDTIATDFNLSENQKQLIYNIIDATVADNKYTDTFGEKPIRNTNISKTVCGSYYYDQNLNSYFTLAGCGGTSPYASYYYKTKYTEDDDHAYVYMQTAVLNYENGKIYCDAGNFESEDAEICGTGTQDGYGYTFSENDISRDSLATYRFVFNKADNGTYYFDKTERL